MMLETRINKRVRIFVLIIAIFFFFIGVGIVYAMLASPSVEKMILALTFGLFLTGFCGAGIAAVLRTRLVIDDEAFHLTGIFRTRTVYFGDVEGYRYAGYSYLHIVPRGRKRGLKISHSLERIKEVQSWVHMRFENLDAVRNKQDVDDILANRDFGETKSERWMSLRRANSIATAGSANGVALALWEIFYPEPYEILMYVLLLAPWIALYGIWYSKGLLRFLKAKGSGYPSLSLLIAFPIMGISVAVIRDFKLYRFNETGWGMMTAMTTVIVGAVLVLARKSLAPERMKALVTILVVLFSAAYSFGLTVFSNCFYDKGPAEEMTALVQGKRTTSGRSQTHYLRLSAWGKFADGHELDVNGNFYNAVAIGDTLHIYLQQGKWGIPWYWLAR